MNTKAVIHLSDRAKLCLIIAVLLPLGCSHMSAFQTDVSRITKEEMVSMLGGLMSLLWMSGRPGAGRRVNRK